MDSKSRKLVVAALVAATLLGAALFVFRDNVFGLRPSSESAESANKKTEQERVLTNASIVDPFGKAAQLFTLLTPSERPKKSILSLWATWCEPCVHELPLLAKAANERLAKEDVQVVLVNYDEGEPEKVRAEVKAWLISQRIPMTTYFDFDHKLIDSLKVEGLPAAIAVGSDRKVQWARIGELNWDDVGITVRD